MRIIAGLYKGQRVDFARHIRPTQDKVRQSIFDYLAGAIKDSRVLDVYSGSGAFGLEALSRGAKEAVFIDIDKRCTRVIRANLEKFKGRTAGKEQAAISYTQDASRALAILAKRRKKFDLIFLDPPYHKDLAKKALKETVESGILAPYGFVVIEHAKQEPLSPEMGELRLLQENRYGNTMVSFYR